MRDYRQRELSSTADVSDGSGGTAKLKCLRTIDSDGDAKIVVKLGNDAISFKGPTSVTDAQALIDCLTEIVTAPFAL